jgi:hypothetical protein
MPQTRRLNRARREWLAWLLVCLSLLMALWPVGRLAMAGFEPSLEQLLQLRCTPDGKAGRLPSPSSF